MIAAFFLTAPRQVSPESICGNDSITHCQAEQPAQDGHLKPDRLALEFCTTLLYVLAEKSSLIYLDKNAAADNPARFGRENLSRSCRELGQMVY